MEFLKQIQYIDIKIQSIQIEDVTNSCNCQKMKLSKPPINHYKAPETYLIYHLEYIL